MDSQNSSFGKIQSASMIEEKPPHTSHVRMIFITTIISLLAVGGYIALSREDVKSQLQSNLKLIQTSPEKNSASQEVKLMLSEIKDRTLPWIEVTSSKQEVVAGETIEVIISASSQGKDITGYDLLIGLDPASFEVVSTTSLMEDFQVFYFDRDDYQSITGVKDLNKKNPTVFANTPLVKMVLKAKGSGDQAVVVLSTKGQERTQFVDSSVQVMIPQTGSLVISVK